MFKTVFKNLNQYHIPKSLPEAVKLLGKEKNARVIAGGTDLFLLDNSGITTLIDITKLKLNYIKAGTTSESPKFLKIGAATTINEMANSPVLKQFAGGILAETARSFAYNNIKNLGTIGGNIAGRHSSADLIPALLALEAKLVIHGKKEQIVDIDKFLADGKKTALNKSIITEIIIPAEYEKSAAKFIKFSRVKNDIALVNCACLIKIKDNIIKKINLAYGCCGSVPVRIYELEKFLQGTHICVPYDTDKNIKKALNIIERNIKPVTDHRASAEYRSEIAKELFAELITQIL